MTDKNRDAVPHPPLRLEELAFSIADHVTAMLAYWDKDLVCRYANSAYVEWFGKTKEEMINTMRIDELLGPLYVMNRPYIEAVLLGEKQLFEREIPMPHNGGVRHSLATYIPDIKNGAVAGFFVHVADVTHMKILENEIAISKRALLRNIIETEELEKRQLAETLNESVNQTLAACKMAIDIEAKKHVKTDLDNEVTRALSNTIREIDTLCKHLIPSEIEIIGLVEALHSYIAGVAAKKNKVIRFTVENEKIEDIALMDKYLIYRIIQNLLTMTLQESKVNNIATVLHLIQNRVSIELMLDAGILLDKKSKEYSATICRVEYHSGNLVEKNDTNETLIHIEFPLS